MVKNIIISKVIKQLEKYFLKQSGFALDGETYSMILLEYLEGMTHYRYALRVSNPIWDSEDIGQTIQELSSELRTNLPQEIYSSLYSTIPVKSTSNLVKYMQEQVFSESEITMLNNINAGNVEIEKGYLIKSIRLERLVIGKKVILIDKTGEYVVGKIIGIEKETFRIIYQAQIDEEMKYLNWDDIENVLPYYA